MNNLPVDVLIRGGGDLASGVAYRLHKAGMRVLITEIEQPLAVRRLASFAQAVYCLETMVEGIRGIKAEVIEDIIRIIESDAIPVIVDPDLKILDRCHPLVLVDARMIKQHVGTGHPADWMTIGLGPGFEAGKNCAAVIETQRGHFLGRVYWKGKAAEDTGIPEAVGNQKELRVLRAPVSGFFTPLVKIGDIVTAGTPLATIEQREILAAFNGMMRGLIHAGVWVEAGIKIGDLDPRQDLRMCTTISDKALAIGGGVLEAILSVKQLRKSLWKED